MFFPTLSTLAFLVTYVSAAPAATSTDTECVRDGNRKLALGEKMAIGEAVYECKRNEKGYPSFAAWGCAANDGSQHPGGDSFEDDTFWYTCQLNKNGVVSLELSGCINEKTRFKNGDMFFRGNAVYECQVSNGGGNLKVIGCMQEDPHTGRKIERRVGCTWTEGDTPYLVTMTCTPDQATKSAVPTVVRCNYKMPEGTIYSINIGCYRVFEKVAVGCLKDKNSDKVTAVPMQLNARGEAQSVPAGLAFC